MTKQQKELIVIGGGLAGTEAAWQAANAGIHTKLYEMRPVRKTPAHATNDLAELVCSNSLGSTILHKAPGLLKAEMRGLGSLILDCAEKSAVPSGSALAVDREGFAQRVTSAIADHPHIELIREEMTHIPDTPCVIASGPLTSDALVSHIQALSSQEYLYFFDALSPIVEVDSVNMDIAFRASRYDEGDQEEGDYINCPMTKEEYDVFFDALISAETINLREFELNDPRFLRDACHWK